MVKSRNPLEPTSTLVNVGVAFVAILTLLGAVATVFGSGSLFGIGSSSVCAEVRNGTVPIPRSGDSLVQGARDGVSTPIRNVDLCTHAPTDGQRALGTLTELPTVLVFVGALVLAVRMFRSVRRNGIFDGHVATRLRNIGSLILFGGLLASVGEAMATYALADTMLVEPIGTWTWLNGWDVPLLAVFFGAALVSFARVMRISIDMRTELDETV